MKIHARNRHTLSITYERESGTILRPHHFVLQKQSIRLLGLRKVIPQTIIQGPILYKTAYNHNYALATLCTMNIVNSLYGARKRNITSYLDGQSSPRFVLTQTESKRITQKKYNIHTNPGDYWWNDLKETSPVRT
jgi:hypothetical protein